MLDAADTRSLALLYHLNSEPSVSSESYEDGYEPFEPVSGCNEGIALPRGGEGSRLQEVIQRRRSCRAFSMRPLALEDLAEILAGTYGPTRPEAVGAGFEIEARSVPSAGGLYPLELYVLLQRVETLDDGLYHYDALEHALEPVGGEFERTELAAALVEPFFLEHANAIVVLTAVFDRTLHKYGARGYRFVLFEAGHAAQNLCLLATERGLASLCVGGFLDAPLNSCLGLDGRAQAAVYCVGLGHSSEA